jgi:hypothetical protein
LRSVLGGDCGRERDEYDGECAAEGQRACHAFEWLRPGPSRAGPSVAWPTRQLGNRMAKHSGSTRHASCSCQQDVRVRITCGCGDEIDGVALSSFEVGLAYEVSTSLGSYLVAIGCAETVLDDELSPGEQEDQQFRVNVKRWRAVAAEATHRRSRRGSS